MPTSQSSVDTDTRRNGYPIDPKYYTVLVLKNQTEERREMSRQPLAELELGPLADAVEFATEVNVEIVVEHFEHSTEYYTSDWIACATHIP